MADKDKNIDEPQTIDGSPEYEDNEEKAEADEDIDPSTFPEKDLKKNLSYKQVAINKGLDVPDEDTGLVFTEHISSNCFKKFKGQSLEDFRPNEEEIGLINQLSMIPQAAPAWMCLRDVDPIGPPEAVDSQGDRFSKESTKDLVEQAINTPILMDHNHDIADRPPIGTCIKSRMTPKGPRETWAIPIEDYNGAIIKGLLNGTVNKVSVGMLIMPDNKI